MDREKVIKGLECCQLAYECEPYKNCPYSNRFACGDCNINQLHYDALALLKEQDKKIEELEERVAIMAEGNKLIQDESEPTFEECIKGEGR